MSTGTGPPEVGLAATGTIETPPKRTTSTSRAFFYRGFNMVSPAGAIFAACLPGFSHQCGFSLFCLTQIHAFGDSDGVEWLDDVWRWCSLVYL